jgi:hypothetical protein
VPQHAFCQGRAAYIPQAYHQYFHADEYFNIRPQTYKILWKCAFICIFIAKSARRGGEFTGNGGINAANCNPQGMIGF